MPSIQERVDIDDGLEVVNYDEVELEEDDTQTPDVPRPRGRPKKTRMKGYLECVTSSSDENGIRCSLCQQLGHNRRSCERPLPSSSQKKNWSTQ